MRDIARSLAEVGQAFASEQLVRSAGPVSTQSGLPKRT